MELSRRRVLRQIGRRRLREIAQAVSLGLIAGAACSGVAAARQSAAIAGIAAPSGPLRWRDLASFKGVEASPAVRILFAWIAASHDNKGLPFIIIDKVNAKVFVFDGLGSVRGAAPALLGLGRGDNSVPGIGRRKLATILPAERTTPAGRFQASLGNDFDQDILWVDYDSALSLHRVIVGNRADRRHARLASATPLDNRVSYGCINVPAQFYDAVVAPAFKGTVGIVYILPEIQAMEAVFAMGDNRAAAVAIP